MKHLFPTITCLLTAHMKPTLGEAIQSVLSQTRQDFALVIVDSGQWAGKNDPVSKQLSEIYLQFVIHPRIEWVFTGERQNMSQSVCMVSHVFNQAYEAGLLQGQFICTFYDDDLYYPTFFEKMAGFLEENRGYDAVRCSETWVKYEKGSKTPLRELVADRDLTSADQFDCVVDGMQVMWRKEVLDRMEKPLMTTRPDECRHSDGLFFEKMKHHISKMGHIPEALCEHRFTPHSTFTPSGAI